MGGILDQTVRASGGRIVAALAARFRNLDLAEDSFAEACMRAAETWVAAALPRDPAAWLYRTAERRALDALRRRATHSRLAPLLEEPEAAPEDDMAEENRAIPDERLRLIFVCCHPAMAAESRAALTLRLVCGLQTDEIARAFLVAESTLAQRLTRAKKKIAEAGVPFEIPAPEAWPERLDAVLSTLEVAYSKAHEDAAGAGRHAGFAPEMLDLTRVLAELMPEEPGALALAATVRYAEARRPARLDGDGAMVPLSEQDPSLWLTPLIAEADAYLARATLGPAGPRVLQAAIHAAWCGRPSLDHPVPWPRVLSLYDALMAHRDDPVVRLNRAVALAEIAGPAAALAEVDALDSPALAEFAPYHAVRADFLRRCGRWAEAQMAYRAALSLGPAPAESRFLTRRMESLGAT